MTATLATRDTDMTLSEAIRQRRSVRGYLATPVPEATLQAVFELAQWAPSNCNVQPWQVYVASGATRDQLRQRFLDNVEVGLWLNGGCLIGCLHWLICHRIRRILRRDIFRRYVRGRLRR